MSKNAFNKPLDEIRPARGVKLENKKQENRIKENRSPQVVQGISSSNEDLPQPTEDATKLVAELSLHKQELVGLMKEFNKLLNIKTLPENKTSIDKDIEQSTINKLIQSTLDVEKLSPKEGLLALCILSLRQALSLRDAGNELAFKVSKLEDRITKLENSKIEEKHQEKKIEPEEKKSNTSELQKQMIDMSNLLKKLAEENHE